MIYGAILDGRIAWREAQRQHAVCGLLCGGSCGGRRPVVVIIVAASHEDASEPPATRDLLLLKGHKPLWVVQSARSTHRKNGLGLII